MLFLVDSNAKGEVRGYVTNPQTHFELNEHGKLDVRERLEQKDINSCKRYRNA